MTVCPNCGAEISFDRASALGECPVCAVPIGELFAIANGRLEPRRGSR